MNTASLNNNNNKKVVNKKVVNKNTNAVHKPLELTNILITGILDSSSSVAEMIIQETEWKEHQFDMSNYKHERVYNLIRKINQNNLPDTINESDDETEQLIAQLASETSRMKVDKFFDVNDFIVNRVLSADKFVLYLRKIERSKRHKALMAMRTEMNDNWSRSWEFNTNKSMRDLSEQYKRLNISCNIMNVSRAERRFKYQKESYRKARDDKMARILPEMMKKLAKTVTSTQEVQDVTNDIHHISNCATDATVTFRKFKDDACCSINKIETNVAKTSSKIQAAADKLSDMSTTFTTRVANRIDDITSTLSNAVDSIRNQMEALGESVENVTNVYNVLVFLGKLLAAGYLIHKLHAKDSLSASTIAAIVVMLIPTTAVGHGCEKMVTHLKRAIQGGINYVTGRTYEEPVRMSDLEAREDQIFLQPVILPQVDAHDERSGAINNMFWAMWYTVKNLFVGVKEDEFLTKARLTTRLKMVAENVKSVRIIGDFFIEIISKLVNLICDLLMTHFGFVPFFMEKDRFKPLVETYYQLRAEKAEQTALSDPVEAERVVTLHKELLEFEEHVAANASKVNSLLRITPYLKAMIAWCENLIKRIPDHVLGDETRKIAPFWLYIHGPPRIGKSEFFQPYIVNELVKVLKIRDTYSSPQNISFLRNPNDQYWDQYQGQPVVQYNDLFQECYNEEKVGELMSELTSVVDATPLSLVVAFEGKGKTYFRSKLVVSNAQDDLVGQAFIKSWSGGTHLLARRSVVVRMDIHRKYMNAQGVIDHAVVNQALQNDPCILSPDGTPLIPKDMYILTFTNPLDGSILHRLTFESGVEYILRIAAEKTQSQTKFRDRLFHHLEDTWSAATVLTPQPVHIAPPDANQYTIDIRATAARNDNNRLRRPAPHPPGPRPQIQAQMDDFKECSSDEMSTSGIEVSATPRNTACSCAHQIALLERLYSMYMGVDVLKVALEDIHVNTCLQDNEWFDRASDIVEKEVQRRADQKANSKEKTVYYDPVKKRMIVQGEEAHAETLRYRNRQPWYKHIVFITLGCGILTALVTTAVRYIVSKGINYYRSKKQEKVDQPVDAQSHEVKHVGRRLTRRIVKGQIYTNNNCDVENVLRSSLARISIQIDDQDLEYGANVICVGGDVFASPRHYWYCFQQLHDMCEKKKHKFGMTLTWITGATTPIHWDSIERWDPNYEHTGDITYFRIPKLSAHRDITAMFRPATTPITTYGSYLFGLRSMRSDIDGKPTPMLLDIGQPTIQSATYPTSHGDMPYFNEPFVANHIECDQIFVYDKSMTHSGDCGMLLMHTDENCPGKVYGMHVAGASNMSYGYSVPMYREDIIEAREHFTENTVIPQMEEPRRFFSPRLPRSRIYNDVKEIGLEIIGSLQKEDGTRLSVTLPRKNKVKPSMVHHLMEEDFGIAKFAPTKLVPFTNAEGIVIKPLKKALLKLKNYTAMIPQDVESQIIQHINDTINEYISPVPKMIMSDFDMINGNSWSNAIDMTTSPGFPYISMKSGSKKQWFEVTEENGKYIYKPGEFVMSEYRDRIEKAKKGIIKETYFVVSLKDELRPINKVEQGKTRIFQNGPVDFTMAVRKYFGAWIEHCHYRGVNKEFSGGINPNSIDWTIIASYLHETGNLHRFGDYENFDSTASHQSGCSYADSANAWYDDGPENAAIRRTLASTAVYSMQIIDDMIVLFRQGNPSGWRGTTHFNDFNNMRYHRYAYLTLSPLPLSLFDRNYRGKFGGDDNVVTWSPKALEYITPELWTNCLLKIGVTYTDANKDKNIVVDQKFEAVSFLKRKWIYDNKRCLYLAPLDFDVIDNIPRWSEGDPTIMEDQMQRFNACLLELSNYSEKIFYQYRNKFSQYCGLLRQNGMDIRAGRLLTLPECDVIKYPHLYNVGAPPHLTPLLNFSLTQNPECQIDCISRGALRDQGKHRREFSGNIVLNPESQSRTGNNSTKTNENQQGAAQALATPKIEDQSNAFKHVARRMIRRNMGPHIVDTTDYLHEVAERYEHVFGEKADIKSLTVQSDIKPQMDVCNDMWGSATYYDCNISYDSFFQLCYEYFNQTATPSTICAAGNALRVGFWTMIIGIVIYICGALTSVYESFTSCPYETPNIRPQHSEPTTPPTVTPASTRRNSESDASNCANVDYWQYIAFLKKMDDVKKKCENLHIEPQMMRSTANANNVEAGYEFLAMRWMVVFTLFETMALQLRSLLVYSFCEHEVCNRFKHIIGRFAALSQSGIKVWQALGEYTVIAQPTLRYTDSQPITNCDGLTIPAAIAKYMFWLTETLEVSTCIATLMVREHTERWNALYEVRGFEMDAINLLSTCQQAAKNVERESPSVDIERIKSFRAKYHPVITPQIDNVPADANIQQKVEEITTFVDKNEEHPVSELHHGRRIKNNFPRTDIESLLTRPFPVGEYLWKPTDTTGKQLFRISLPEALFKHIYAFISKTVYWAPSFEVEFRLNAAPQQYGSIVICPYPNGSIINPQFYSLASAVTGEWAKLRAGINQVVTFKLDFIHVQDRIPIVTNGDGIWNIWNIAGYVLSPLTSIAATSQDISISVFARVLNPTLSGHRYSDVSPQVVPQMQMIDDDEEGLSTRVKSEKPPVNEAYVAAKKTQQISNNRVEDEEKTKSGGTHIVSKMLGIAGNAGLALAPIPEIGWVLGAIGGLLKGGSWLASHYGFSMNRNLVPPTPMFNRGPTPWRHTDLYNTITPSANDSKLTVDYSMVNSTADDISIIHYIQRPTIIAAPKITSTMLVGDTIFSQKLGPREMLVRIQPPSAGTVNPTPIYRVADFFRMWHGSFCFNLCFLCTPFHSCRVRISFYPRSSPDTSDTSALFDYVGTVLDITKDTEICFSVPYFYDTSCMLDNEYFGTLNVTLLNRMVDGGTGAAPIFMEVSVFAGADFQFFGPKTCTEMHNTVPNILRKPATVKADITPQMDIVTGKCDLPSASFSCLRRQKYPPMGGIESAYTLGTYTSAEEIISFKQLTNMLTPIHSSGFPLPYAMDFFRVNCSPYGINTGEWANQGHNIMCRVASLFGYWRGGVRFNIQWTVKNPETITVHGTYQSPYTTATVTLGSKEPNPLTLNCFTHVDYMDQKITDYTIPYIATTRCRIMHDEYSIADEADGNHLSLFFTLNPKTSGIILIGGADDFICGYQMPQLPLYKNLNLPAGVP